jgi:hypothetical protein
MASTAVASPALAALAAAATKAAATAPAQAAPAQAAPGSHVTKVTKRAVLLRDVDLSKLKLVPASAVPPSAVAHLSKAKRARLLNETKQAAANKGTGKKAQREEGVWLYDGVAGVLFQAGTGSDPDDPAADLFSCWRGLQYWDPSTHRFCTVEHAGDIGFALEAAAANAATNKRAGAGAAASSDSNPTGKAQVALSLKGYTNATSQAGLLYRLLQHTTEASLTAICDGMTLPDGRVYRWNPEGEYRRPFAVKMLKGPLNASGKVNPNTGQEYDPDLKLKMRWYLHTAEDGSGAQWLSTPVPVNDLRTNKPVADAFKQINNSVGKFVFSLSNVVMAKDTEVNFTIELEQAGVAKREMRRTEILFGDAPDPTAITPADLAAAEAFENGDH